MCERPAHEEACRLDPEAARALVPRGRATPETRAADTWVIDAWTRLQSPMLQGNQVQAFRWDAEAEGMDEVTARELWARVLLVDGAVRGYHRAMREQEVAMAEAARG